MSLRGFDLALEVSRGAINKVLAGFAVSPIWPAPFAGEWRSVVSEETKLQTIIAYHIDVRRPLIGPLEFGDEALTQSVEAQASFDASFVADFILEGVPMHRFEQPLSGDVCLALALEFNEREDAIFLELAFQSMEVRRLAFPGVPEHVGQLIQFVAQSVLTHKMNAAPKRVPVFTKLSQELPFLGRIQSLGFKSHWYRTTSGDLAAGICLILDEASSPVPDAELQRLRRCDGGGDVVAAIGLRYLNKCLNRALQQGTVLSRYGSNERPNANGNIRLSAVAVRVIENRLRVDTTISRGNAEIFHGEVTFLLSVVDDRFDAYIISIQGAVPGVKNVAARVAINAVFLAVLWAVGQIRGHDTEENIAEAIERILNNRKVMGSLEGVVPAGGPGITLTPSLVQCGTETIALSFRLDIR